MTGLKNHKSCQSKVYIGGDLVHVHLFTAVRPVVSPSDFMKQVKGSSSHFVTHALKRRFEWQKGYGVFSVSASAIDIVKAYVLNQKAHHANNTLVPEWEESHDWNLGPETREPIPILSE